ncbi:unnamed protein product [Ectocarpus sp. 13 AM-2016]
MQAQQLQDALESAALFVLGSAPMSFLVDSFNALLELLGAPVPPTDAEQLATWIAATMSTLASYYIFFGQRHKRRREHLYTELRRAQLQVARLEEKLLEAEGEEDSGKGGREVRIWMDGAFDMMHYGHMNAFRQGKALGTHLVVGVNSDESIAKCKGPPVMNDQERLTAVEGCKFVDEVVPGVPYVMSPEYLEYVIDKYRIDFVVHGDDPCIVDGKDVYEAAKARGKYRSIPRTEGVSTTDIVGRMLLQSRSHHSLRGEQEIPRLASFNRRREPTQVRSKFLTTSWMLRLFSAGVQAPPKGARVVYIDGAWDMFHAGHVAILKQARDFGDYLIAGVHSDEVVNAQRGLNMPIMNLNERVLSVLGCAYVNDVLIDAPLRMTREMIASLNIGAAVHGTVDDNMVVHATGDEGGQGQEGKEQSRPTLAGHRRRKLLKLGEGPWFAIPYRTMLEVPGSRRTRCPRKLASSTRSRALQTSRSWKLLGASRPIKNCSSENTPRRWQQKTSITRIGTSLRRKTQAQRLLDSASVL